MVITLAARIPWVLPALPQVDGRRGPRRTPSKGRAGGGRALGQESASPQKADHLASQINRLWRATRRRSPRLPETAAIVKGFGMPARHESGGAVRGPAFESLRRKNPRGLAAGAQPPIDV